MSESTEEADYYYDSNGNVVFTEAFLEKRGFCCENGCCNCPYPKDKKSHQSKS